MKHLIEGYIDGMASLSDEEVHAIIDCTHVRTYSKGAILLREGEIANECYFPIQGCVRLYHLVDGEEKTTFFYTEKQPICSLLSYTNRTPANHYLACVEECTLVVLTYDAELALYKRYPNIESVCRVAITEEFAAYQETLSAYMWSTPEERYSYLLQHRPELLNRVPQYQLASYLGVQPESLSRIRKRMASKK